MKILLDVVGCRLNQSEVEGIANTFRALGHTIVDDPNKADLAIVNTCAVTGKAASDSRKKLRRIGRAGVPEVIATGCWATLDPEKAKVLPGVTGVFNNEQKGLIVQEILKLQPEDIAKLQLVRKPLPGERGRTRAFIKVQEGCNNHCTYCLTRIARGKSRSRRMEHIKSDIEATLDGGAKEVVLTGVQLGAWGRDFQNPMNLSDLIRIVLDESGIQRLRLSSIEPWDFSMPMLVYWEDQRLCRHLHIPLQSGSNKILKAMNRPISIEAYSKLVDNIRNAIPEIAITIDVIVGFPGETDDEFKKTKTFIEEMNFAGGHVFTYSPRPGTPAYQLTDPIPIQKARDRNAILREIFRKTSQAYRAGFIDQQVDVLWESSKQIENCTWMMSGLTDTYIRVYAPAPNNLWNQISTVVLTERHPSRDALIGEIIEIAG